MFEPATVVRRFALLSHMYTVAIKDWCWSYLQVNPVQMIRYPSINNARTRRIFTNIQVYGCNPELCPKSEIDWIKQNTKSTSLPIIIMMALQTGMRRSEITRLRREHINFESGTINIPLTKTGRPRSIPLSPLARYELIMYLNKHNYKDTVFKISPSGISRAFIRAIRKSRVEYEKLCERYNQEPNAEYFENLRFHDLRHEATSQLATVYQMHELAKITGHADTRMLLRYYHPDAETLTQKLAQSHIGQNQFNVINSMLLHML